MNYLLVVLSVNGFDVQIDLLAVIENRKGDDFGFSIVDLSHSFGNHWI